MFAIYQNEFLSNPLNQAIDVKDCYKPVNHNRINVGDIVLVKDDHVKPLNFPMGIVKQAVTNVNGETTGAVVLKGKTLELTKRHVSSLIPLLTCDENSPNGSGEILAEELPDSSTESSVKPKTTKKTALESTSKTRDILYLDD